MLISVNLKKFLTFSNKANSLNTIFSSFLSFRFQYKGQNPKFGNLGNFLLPQVKHIPWNLQVLKIFPSFLSFLFQYKDQNRKHGNLRNFLLPQVKKSFEIHKSWKYFRVFRVFDFSVRAKVENSETSEIPTSSNKTFSLNFTSLEKISEFSEFSISV